MGYIEDTPPFLHFEVCYHQAIDLAIECKLKVVEAETQGEHKLVLGYRPFDTQSAHYILHLGLWRVIAEYLEREQQEVIRIRKYPEEHWPFRCS